MRLAWQGVVSKFWFCYDPGAATTSCVTLGESPNFSVPSSPSLNEANERNCSCSSVRNP